MDRVRSFLNLERGEEAPVFLLFSYLTLALASYTIIRAARDGLFLFKFSAYSLPYAYLGIAAVIGFVVSIYLRLSARFGQAAVISGSLLFFITNILAQWWAVRVQWAPVTWIFYVWTSIFGIITVTQVWTVANQVLDMRQAKRLFPLISSGGVMGSALGGVAAARLAKLKSVGTDNLILVIVPLLLLAGFVAQLLLTRYSHLGGKRQAGENRIGLKKAFQAIANSPYLKIIVVLLALSNVVTMVVGIQFGAVVQHAFPAKNQIASFMGSVSACFSLMAFLLQVLAGSRLVEKFGVRIMLLALPTALLGGTLVLLAYPLALWAGLVLKGSDYTLRYSVDRATTELLYLPLPQSTKSEVKALIDMVMQRLADGVGALLVLFVTVALKGGQAGLCVLDLILLAAWMRTALQARTQYRKEVSKIFLAGPEPLPKPVIQEVFSESASVASLRTMLASPDEEVVLTAIQMAVDLGRPGWISADLAAHRSPRVRAKALESAPLSEEGLLERVKKENDPTVRASAMLRVGRESSGVGLRGGGLLRFLEAPDLRLRLAALVALARQDSEIPAGTIKKALQRFTTELAAEAGDWEEVAEALGDISSPEAVELHLGLLQHANPTVKKAAILSAGRAGHRELVPFLIPLLRDARWGPDVRLCLREYGPRILGTLADVLKDPGEEIEIRRSIPLVLAYLPQQESADILLDGLFDYDGLLRYRAIRALGKLRLLNPRLRFDREKIGMVLREESGSAIWCRQALAALYPQGSSHDLLEQLLKDKVSRGKDRVFRLLALLLPPTAAISALLAMAEGDRLKRAAVAEFLDDVLPGKFRESVLAVIEPKAQLLRSAQTVPQILEACLRNPDLILRECAAEAIGKNRWPEYSAARAS
jgi:AAA family ATP:ADP antiporter